MFSANKYKLYNPSCIKTAQLNNLSISSFTESIPFQTPEKRKHIIQTTKFMKWEAERLLIFLNAKIQRIHYNSTIVRKRKKCHYGFLAVVAHFLFQKLECNREKSLYCGYSTVFDKKKKTDYSIKIVSLICERSYILIELY